MSKKSKLGLKQILVGTGLAAVAGYLAGILTAPKSGKQTRGDIKRVSKHTVKQAEKEVKHLQSEADDAVKQLKSQGAKASQLSKKEMDELVTKTKANADKAKTVATAMKKGEASDEDLNKAVKQARQSIKNVTKYLKK